MRPLIDNPLLELLGIRLICLGENQCIFELDVEHRHLNSTGKLQGGVSATLLDAACGYAGLLQEDGTLGSAVTLMLAISYLGSVRAGRVRAVAELTYAGREIYFSAAKLTNETGKIVATAQGTFKRSRIRKEH